jgi:hypothetical protein
MPAAAPKPLLPACPECSTGMRVVSVIPREDGIEIGPSIVRCCRRVETLTFKNK